MWSTTDFGLKYYFISTGLYIPHNDATVMTQQWIVSMTIPQTYESNRESMHVIDSIFISFVTSELLIWTAIEIIIQDHKLD
jgi:hypothetical protein